MIKILLFLSTLIFAISTEDLSSAGFNKLTESQKAEIIKATENMAKAPDTTKTLVHQVSQWADVGIKIGAALGACAKELNVAVNDFLQTPAGKFTFFMIAWRIMANDIIHVGGGLLFLFIGLMVAWKFYRNWTAGTITYDKDKVDIFKRPIKYVTRSELSDNESAAIVGVVAITIIISAFAIYSL